MSDMEEKAIDQTVEDADKGAAAPEGEKPSEKKNRSRAVMAVLALAALLFAGLGL